ncbi:uncharacterized protein LOC122258212 [Penaeus japonicus]|uniref:uncharacterized protein LOC122258212 n=1 Tax=Penaeus japonicus TaxID=27405 RepID=UPI001C716B70|nr:uncharacterized protein LOC122258212 [Penaeus japonicus]XP_042879950.1 uncharacterized protein LOC122258212 [Penaeus japonicus]
MIAEHEDEQQTIKLKGDEVQIFTKQEFVYKEEVFGSDDDNESQTIYPLPDVTNESSVSDCSPLNKSPVETKLNSINQIGPFDTKPNTTMNTGSLEGKEETLVQTASKQRGECQRT